MKFVNIPINRDDNSGTYIKEIYDQTFDHDLYRTIIDNDVPPIYDQIYEYIRKQQSGDKIIFTSRDVNTSVPIISGLNENHMYQDNEDYLSDLKIIIFDNKPRLNIFQKREDNIMSCLLGSVEHSVHHNKLPLRPEQIMYIGIDEAICDIDQMQRLEDYGIIYFTLDRIKKLGIGKVLEFVSEEINNVPVLMSLNSKSVYQNSYGDNEINFIIKYLRQKVQYINITDYDDFAAIQSASILKYIKILLVEIMDIKEKKLNIFTENSRFLIYREVEPIADNDNGWYILRFLDNDTKEKILEKISDNDDIIPFTIEDDDGEEIDILVSSTTIEEQEQMAYDNDDGDTNNIFNKCLYPIEKYSMVFELVNATSLS